MCSFKNDKQEDALLPLISPLLKNMPLGGFEQTDGA
jgi:hypothetical protein